MGDKGKNLLKGLFFLMVAVSCVSLALGGGADTKIYPWVGAAISLFMTINYVKKAFEK